MALSMPNPAKGSQHMLDGVNLDVAFGERRGASRVADVLDLGLDLRFALQIDAAEAQCRCWAPARAGTSC